ncbi:hypothetical protein KZK14_005080 [Salmonella enterica]|nr:hypothetical protein [Salmonella enterica]
MAKNSDYIQTCLYVLKYTCCPVYPGNNLSETEALSTGNNLKYKYVHFYNAGRFEK